MNGKFKTEDLFRFGECHRILKLVLVNPKLSYNADRVIYQAA